LSYCYYYYCALVPETEGTSLEESSYKFNQQSTINLLNPFLQQNNYTQNDEVKEDAIVWACSMHGSGIGGKARRKETTTKATT
jgi:hypothetical protein